jgi:hypothetical protein
MNTTTGKKIKIPRVVRMHSDEMQEVDEVKVTRGLLDSALLTGLELFSHLINRTPRRRALGR